MNWSAQRYFPECQEGQVRSNHQSVGSRQNQHCFAVRPYLKGSMMESFLILGAMPLTVKNGGAVYRSTGQTETAEKLLRAGFQNFNLSPALQRDEEISVMHRSVCRKERKRSAGAGESACCKKWDWKIRQMPIRISYPADSSREFRLQGHCA